MELLKILIIILGSHIDIILHDRVNISLNYIKENNYNNTNVEFLLTGGKKNNDNNVKYSEAEKMLNILSLNDTNYYIDDISTNTVENFYYISKIVNNNNYTKIIISTSKFHYRRANKIASYFINNINFNIEWILGYETLENSYDDERYHYTNIESDINSLKYKFNF